MTERDDLVNRLRKKHLDVPKGKAKKKNLAKRGLSKLGSGISSYLASHKIGVAITGGVVAATLVGGGIVGHQYLKQRQTFPLRDVIYHVDTRLDLSGGDENFGKSFVDRNVDVEIRLGQDEDVKVTGVFAKIKKQRTETESLQNLLDGDNRRISDATRRDEILQAGVDVRGATNYSERYAEVKGTPGKFLTYRISQDRNLDHYTIYVLKDGEGEIADAAILHEQRGKLGIFKTVGLTNRASTSLYDIRDTDYNDIVMDDFFEKIREFHNTTSKKARKILTQEMVEIIKDFETDPVYRSFEDGILDLLPQESSTYIFSDPDVGKKFPNAWTRKNDNEMAIPKQGTKKTYPRSLEDAVEEVTDFAINNPSNDLIKIRVENYLDLFPGNIPLLSQINLGDGENPVRPFDHQNNGGYIIRDGKGAIAQVDIQDFWRFYGDDVLYSYYLDKNGDGAIDKESELIGKVLRHMNRDEKETLDEFDKGRPRANQTQLIRYTFMKGNETENWMSDFYLCNAIESFVVNEVNRGFGKHSNLGWINSYRSNILLRHSPTLPNLSRASSVESGLVAKHDILALLRATGRDYVEQYVKPTQDKLANN